ncbi:11020_t:CDS:1, partial [Paraglomus brasilianum]
MSTLFDKPAENWTYDAIAANCCLDSKVGRAFSNVQREEIAMPLKRKRFCRPAGKYVKHCISLGVASNWVAACRLVMVASDAPLAASQ